MASGLIPRAFLLKYHGKEDYMRDCNAVNKAMKYGETLRQRSIPAWSHHNIDYDDIKYLIKERTTPGHGKSIAIPGRSDEKLAEFENALFQVLQDQHSRIDLFVRSKAGEIRRRLDHSRKQLKRLSLRDATASEKKIPIRRLERYSRLENDVLKAGDEIKSLARFTGTQRTAFRKLLKKHKKWTGSGNLESRFQDEVLDDPKSFTNLSFDTLLDDYSEILQSIRNLYERRLQQSNSTARSLTSNDADATSAVEQLRSALMSKSKTDFDTAIATIPFGGEGSIANYFVHPDNVVELQVLLLQHLEYYTPKSRSNSAVSCQAEPNSGSSSQDADYFTLVADNLDRFLRDESALTVNEREHLPGFPPQRAKVSVQWNADEDAILSARFDMSNITSIPLKKKHIHTFFERDAKLVSRKDSGLANDAQSLAVVREAVLNDATVCPLYSVSTCRSRFIGLETGPKGMTLATLDTNIAIRKADKNPTTSFPYAILHVRQEDQFGFELLSILDCSHLVERVRGFSLQYHALWQTYTPENIAQPFWIPILSRDIRKLPPPAIKEAGSSAAVSSGSQSATRRSGSTVDSTTAVETEGQISSAPLDQLEAPPLRLFRKKRRRTYADHDSQQKYWSEYDHPEDGQPDSDAYVLYIDPNERTTLDRLLEKFGSIFRSQDPEDTALLTPNAMPEEGETSSDDELAFAESNLYGTIPSYAKQSNRLSRRASRRHLPFIPPMTSICLAAAIATLIFAYILAIISKDNYATEVATGILVAVGCSLTLGVIGFIPLLRRRGGSWLSIGVGFTVLILDAICSGGLLAWVLG